MQDRYDRTLDIVSDPRSTPVRSVIYDPHVPERWIRLDEADLVELAAVR